MVYIMFYIENEVSHEYSYRNYITVHVNVIF